MSRIDSLFTDIKEEHLIINYFKRKNIDKNRVRVEVIHKRELLGFQPAQIFIHIDGTSPQFYPWDDELNKALLEFGAKAINEENEAIRFALTMRSDFSNIEGRYGEGFFNGVLIKMIKETFSSGNKEIEDLLKNIPVYEPATNSNEYNDCKYYIEQALSKEAKYLLNKLDYNSREHAETILTEALAHFLDERFSVSSRRELGWT
jgi:hypothetical protein